MHPNSWLLFGRPAVAHFRPGMLVLEIRPDERPSTYEQIVAVEIGAVDWETADIADYIRPDRLMADENNISLADGTFDLVLAGEVIEHVRRPWVWVKEVARVARPGGVVVLIAPVSWPYHEVPVDCWRVYPEGMRALAEDAGLEVIECGFGSLEPPPSRRSHPGGERLTLELDRSLKGRAERFLGWPQPVAFDTTLIARKAPTGPSGGQPGSPR